MTLEQLQKMVTQFPDDALMRFTLGQKYYDQNELKEAQTQLIKANELDKTHLLTYLLLANTYISEMENDKAKQLLEDGLAVMPTLPAGSGQDLEPEFKMALEEIEDEF